MSVCACVCVCVCVCPQQGTFSVEERRRAFYLMGQLFPEAAALAAALLGFDPDAVVPQLLSDMEEYRRYVAV